jgi:peptide/nickel transport system substrate-binding protein
MEGHAVRKALIALALALTLCLTGCVDTTVTTEPEPEVSVSPSAAPERTAFALPYYSGVSLHPITGSGRTNLVPASLVYQGLFALDNSFEPQEVLCASSAVSEDGLTWSFTLTDAVFSDGTPLTADDVAASLELARTSTLYADRLSAVRTVEAGEDGTVVVTLSAPNGALPALLDIPVVRDGEEGEPPLGTGPYAYAQEGGQWKLIRQPSAPDTAPAEIPLVAVDGADDLIYAFDAGEVSLVVSDLTGANALGYSAGYEVFSYPTTTLLYVGFQTASGPCEDALVRQAISRSFDRDTVTASLLAGYGDATCLPFSPRSALYSAQREQAGSYSSETAQALLTQAGYTVGEDGLRFKGRTALALTLVVNTDNSFKLSVAEYLAGQLTELGIQVEVQKLAWADYLTALTRGEFDLYLGEVALTPDFDLSPLLGQGGELNYGGYASAETDVLLSQLCAATGSARTRAADALLEQFQADAPLAPLCFKRYAVLTQWQAVTGLEPTYQNPFAALASLRFGGEE